MRICFNLLKMDPNWLNFDPREQALMNAITEDLFSDPDSMKDLFQELISDPGSAMEDVQGELQLLQGDDFFTTTAAARNIIATYNKDNAIGGSGSSGDNSPRGSTDYVTNIPTQEPAAATTSNPTPLVITKECQVCSRSENGDLSAFGGRSCASCRAFFRRAVQDNRIGTFSCTRGTCPIDSRSKRSCQGCRFKRCVEMAGMRQNLVKRARWEVETKKKINFTPPHESSCITYITSLLASDITVDLSHLPPSPMSPSSPQTPLMSLIRGPSALFTTDEARYIMGLYTETRNSLMGSFVKMTRSHQGLLEESCEFALTGRSRNWKNVIMLLRSETTVDDLLLPFLHDLHSLDEEDQETLMRANFPLMHVLFESSIFDSRININYYYKYLLQQEPLKGNIQSFLRLHNADLDSLDIPPLHYQEIYQKERFSSEDTFARHRELVMTLGHWTFGDPFDSFRRLDKVKIMLMAMVMLFSGKGLHLGAKSAAAVEGIQKKYSHMLYRYLVNTHGKSVICEQKLHQGMVAGDLAREILGLNKHIKGMMGRA